MGLLTYCLILIYGTHRMNRDKLRKTGIYAIAVLVIIKFIYLPVKNKIKAYQDMLNEKTESYNLKQRNYNNLISMLSRTDNTKNQLLLKKIFSQETSDAYIQTKLLEYSQTVIKNTKLEMLTFEFPAPAEKEGVKEISILLRLKGTARDMLVFMDSCKNFEKIVVIKSFENTRSSDTDQTMFYKVRLTTYKLNKEGL